MAMSVDPPDGKSMTMIAGGNSAAPVKWANDSLAVGSINHLGFSDVSSHWWPNYYVQPASYHYTYTGVPSKPNPTEMAFKIVAKLLEDGLVKELTVNTFVKLVDDVAKIVKES